MKIDNRFYPSLPNHSWWFLTPRLSMCNQGKGKKGVNLWVLVLTEVWWLGTLPKIKNGGLEMVLLFKGGIFRFHRSFRGCNISYSNGWLPALFLRIFSASLHLKVATTQRPPIARTSKAPTSPASMGIVRYVYEMSLICNQIWQICLNQK